MLDLNYMKIFFIRHGESEANVKRLFAGQKEDSPLTEKGRQQAADAGRSLKDYSVNLIFSSPLKRAKETAQIISEQIGYPASKIAFDDRISEYDMGSITGTPIRGVTSAELTSADKAEDPHEFKFRVISFLKSLPEDSCILVVSHAGVGRIIESSRLKLDPIGFYDISPYPNSEAIALDLSWL